MPDTNREAECQKQYRVRGGLKDLPQQEQETALWEQMEYMQGDTFTTSKGLDFTYTIKGGEMFVSRKDKSITRATVLKAYRQAVILDGVVAGPKKLGTFGASYLFPVFKALGIIRTEKDKDIGKNKAGI